MARSHGFAGGTVAVEGLDRLIRDFNRLDPELRRGVQREMDNIGKMVADDAKEDITRRGLVRTGDMRKNVRQRVRGGTVVVRSTAMHPVRRSGKRGGKSAPYNYPKVFEYGKRGGNETGPNAILGPALARNTENIEQALESMFDRLVSQNGFNTGGIL